MRVLMISLDRGLLGEGYSGNVVERHRRYADLAGALDIIVFASAKYDQQNPAPNLSVIPTRSKKSRHYRSAAEIASRLFRQNRYDLLITQDLAAPAGAKIKKTFRVPWLVNVHSMFFTREWLKLNPLNWYLFYLIKKTIKTADAFRVNNLAQKDQIMKWFPDKPVLVQPTPIDLGRFFFPDKPKNVIPVVLFVGRLEREKNLELLISVVKELKENLVLQIVGEGSSRQSLEKLAGGSSRVRFLGGKKQEELPQLFREADIFTLVSTTESFGQVLLQAAAAGCAIITTKTPGALSIFKDSDAAIFININDELALKSALRKVLADQQLRGELARKEQAVAAGFDSEKGIVNTVNYWKEVASSRWRDSQ